jgi:hypothetical protein
LTCFSHQNISQGDQKIRKKSPNFSKNSPKVAEPKKSPKISTTKLNLKAQNIYNKPLWNLKSSPIGKKSPNLVTLIVVLRLSQN